MSVFDFVQNRKRVVQVVLALLVLPFALWGVESYRSGGGGGDWVAKVGGQRVSAAEYDLALKEQQDRAREMLGRNVDPGMLDTPEFRTAVMDNLVHQHMLADQARRVGLAVPDARLAEVIATIEAFQQDGKFSKQRYEYALRNRSMTPMMFESRLRQEVLGQELGRPFTAYGLVPTAAVDRVVRLSEQIREVSVAEILPKNFLARVKIDTAEVRAYYDGHLTEFQVPEQVRLEYIMLSADSLGRDVTVTPEEVQKYYEEHKAQLAQAEERQASHILIAVRADSSEADRSAARAKAEQLAAEAKKNPKGFADLARKNSQDPGSAENGGDLGFFGRGAMTKAFEDAVFEMKPDEIRGPVQTEFGFHVIRLTAVRGGKAGTLEDARQRIESDLKQQKATKKFAETAESFSNMVFEQGDSLKPAAEAFKLEILQTPWLNRKGGQVAFPATERLLQSVFTDDVLKNKRNTEAVEVAPNTLVSARVVEYKPASTRPFEEVSASIQKSLEIKKASEMTAAEGKQLLEKLRAGEPAIIDWGLPKSMSMRTAEGLPPVLARPVFFADVSKLPAYVGTAGPQGAFLIAKISKVTDVEKVDDTRRKAYSQQMRELLAQEEYSAYINSLRKAAEIEVRRQKIQKSQQ